MEATKLISRSLKEAERH